MVNRPSNEQLATLTGGDSFDPNADGSDDATPGASGATATLGLSVQPLTPGIARSLQVDPTIVGVVVAQASPTTDAGQKLKRGDVVSQVNGEPVRTAADFGAAVARAKASGRPQVLLRVTRQRVTAFVAVRLGN
ncbi:MAG: PDZ domain-containing protein [Propionibacteriaceae bacterium]|nr:MAG: PDZ domain-containing protein [Propionibacteriaceae bacterium]